MATDVRGALERKAREITPGDIDAFFFTNGGAEANENAIRIARMFSGRHKIGRAIARTTAEPRAPLTLTAIHAAGPQSLAFPGSFAFPISTTAFSEALDSTEEVLARTEESTRTRRSKTIARNYRRTSYRNERNPVPPDGYLQGLRALCDKHGILLIADEVMAGFGRTGEWFSVDHWKVVPDLISMAKGLTSAYVQLGAVGMRRQIADHFEKNVFYGGLTYNSHPLACAAALATIACMKRTI
jgi:taurine--2-oxoglutarate transaminase